MKILQMIDSLTVGGAEKMQVNLAAVAHTRNVPLTVVPLHHAENTPIPGQLSALGVEVLPFIEKKLLNPMRIWRLAQLVRRERFDLIHAHLAGANIVAA